MATRVAGEATGCVFQWKIESISNCCWLTKGKAIAIGTFIVDALEGTKWKLGLCSMGCTDGRYIGLFLRREEDCSGPDVIEVSFQLAIVSNDGSILTEGTSLKTIFSKGDNFGFPRFETREKIFTTEREVFLPEDTLTVQCAIWNTEEKPVKSKFVYCRTAFKAKQKWFMWRIKKFSTVESGMRKKFKDKSIDFDLILNKGFEKKLDIEMISFDKAIRYISCDASIINSEGKKENFGLNKYFYGNLKEGILSPALLFPKICMESKSRYIPNGVLSLEFIFLTVKRIDKIKTANIQIETTESENTSTLSEDLEDIYKDGLLSDTQLRTSTQIFPAHKVILSVRSPVFSSMFNNNMMERSGGHIYVNDFEDDTIHRMLLYMYTDSLENLQFESSAELYKIADKYQILDLKLKCSAFLKEQLCLTNACEILILANVHSDDDLKSAAQNYLLKHSEQLFRSQEWKDFMRTHTHLAADVMYEKISEE